MQIKPHTGKSQLNCKMQRQRGNLKGNQRRKAIQLEEQK